MSDLASHATAVAEMQGRQDVGNLLQKDAPKPEPDTPVLPFDEAELSPEQLREVWEFGEHWRKTIPELASECLPCWIRHAAHRQEFLALLHGWRLVVVHQASLPTWMAWLESALSRFQRIHRTGCGFNHWDDQTPERDEASLEAVIREREGASERTGASSDPPAGLVDARYPYPTGALAPHMSAPPDHVGGGDGAPTGQPDHPRGTDRV